MYGRQIFFNRDADAKTRTQTFILRHTSDVSYVQRDGRAESPHNDVLHSVLSFSLSKSSHLILMIWGPR